MSQNLFKKRIFFIGFPDMGLVCLTKLLLSGVNIVGVLAPPETEESHKVFMQYAQGFKLNVIKFKNLKDEDFLNEVKSLNADLGLVCSFNKRIPKELLSIPKDGFVNCHPSLLPEYRGANSYSHVIINNESETGITIHKMDENFDTGNILVQYPIKLKGNETMGTLFNYLNFVSANAVLEFIKYYENGGKLIGKEQPKGNFKTAGDISFDSHNNFIDWNKSADHIERFIRALNPFIHAVTLFKNELVQIHYAKVVNFNHNHSAGEVVSVDNGLFIATGEANKVLKITALQYSSYLICDGEEFVSRFNIKVGEKFTNG